MSIPGPEVFSDLSEMSIQELLMRESASAANLRKEIMQLLLMWNEHSAVASMCEYLLKNKEAFNIRPKRAPQIVEGLLP